MALDQQACFQLSRELDKHEMDVRGVTCLPNGMIVTASRDDVVRVWPPVAENQTEETPVFQLPGHTHFIYSVQAGAEGQIVSGDGDGKIIVWDLGTGAPAATLPGHNDARTQQRAVTGLALHAGQLISCGWDHSVRVWSGVPGVAGEYSVAHNLKGHSAAVWAVVVLPDGTVASASADKSIKLWKEDACHKTLTGHTDAVRGLAVLPALGMFVSVSNDGTLRAWSFNGELTQVKQATGDCRLMCICRWCKRTITSSTLLLPIRTRTRLLLSVRTVHSR